jgi:hypothetical protein
MTDLELLFLVLAVLYLWECACWVRRGAVAFQNWFGRWWIAHPGTLLGNAKGGFIMANPLPPLGTLLIGHQLPVSLSAQGVLAFVSPSVNPGWRPAQSGNWKRWDEIQSIKASGKKLLVNGQEFLRTASPEMALHMAEQLETVRKSNASRREEVLRRIVHEHLDIKAVENRWNDFQKQAAALRVQANMLFIYLFLAAPLLIHRFSLERTWLALLLGILVFTVPSSFLFRRIHKNFYPKAEDERFTHFILVLLSPVSAMRAWDLLSRPLLETFHPLAVAKVFCADEQFREFARATFNEVRHPGLPLCPNTDPSAVQTEQQARALLASGIEKVLKQSGLSPGELVQAPAPNDENCRAYCPRCHAQFTTTTAVCDDCGGLPLVPFGTAKPTKISVEASKSPESGKVGNPKPVSRNPNLTKAGPK